MCRHPHDISIVSFEFSLAIPQLLKPKVAGAIATALPFKSLNGAAQDRLCGPGDFRQVWYI